MKLSFIKFQHGDGVNLVFLYVEQQQKNTSSIL